MALANEQGRASMARALVAAMAQSVPVRVERGQPGACSGLITASAVFGLGRVWPGDGDINGDRIGKGNIYESSTEGLVADAVPMWRVGRALCGGRASVGTRLRLARFLACQWVGSWMIMVAPKSIF